MSKIVLFSVIGLIWGCGAGESVMNPTPESQSNNAGSTAPSPVATASASSSTVPCTAGNERIEVTAASGTLVLAASCGTSTTGPSASMLPGAEDGPWPLELVGCAGAASIDVNALEYSPMGGVGSFGGVAMKFDDGTNVLQTWGPVDVQTWGAVGDLVSGTFTSSPEPQAPALSGSFCLRRAR